MKKNSAICSSRKIASPAAVSAKLPNSNAAKAALLARKQPLAKVPGVGFVFS
jgi:hypothetical protein